MTALHLICSQLSNDEARSLTDEVKQDAERLWRKLVELYEGGAHEALGYSSWGAYFEAEFRQSARRGYQLLDAGRVLGSLNSCSLAPANEAQARELAPLLEEPTELTEVWNDLRERHGDRVTAEKIRQAVDERLRRDQVAQVMGSSESFEWYTPGRYVEAAREVLGAIDLDPASSEEANATVRAERFYSADDNGLVQPWEGRVWLNPPYTGLAGAFIRRLVAEYEADAVPAAVALVNAHSTDTEWFQPLWDYPLCFTDHRIGFVSPADPAKRNAFGGSVFAYLGPAPAEFAQVFETFGAIVQRWRAA